MKKIILHLLIGIGLIYLPTNKIFAQYCVPDYTYGSSYDYIAGVELESISNFTAGAAEYNDYTGMSTLLIPGVSYTLTLTNNPFDMDYFAAWIDWNQNGTFISTEKLGSDIIIYAGGTGTITFTVPLTALPGSTRMRIRSVYYPPGSISACGTYNYGETEDYTIFIPAETDYDAGVTAINNLVTACGWGEEPISVNITNIGLLDISEFNVGYQVIDPITGAGTPVIEAYTGDPIASYETAEFTFSTLADLTNNGDYTVYAWTEMDLDTIPADDTSDVSFTNIPVITEYPYNEDFEDGAGGWVSYGASSSWELGSPTGSPISGSPPGTPDSENSWDTNLDGNYNTYETSYVESPCLDFSDLILPYIEFDIWWETYEFNDGAQLEYSTNAGATWTLLGGIGTGDNWYTTYGYSLGYDPVTSEYENGWVGSGGGWKKAHHDISFLAGESSVKFRFKFASSWWGAYDGIAFDNINIQDPYPQDIGVSDLISPVSAVELGSSEIVCVDVTNFGTDTQTSFDVSYSLDGGPVVTEIYTGELLAGETETFCFVTTIDISDDGVYNFCAWTSLPTDEWTANDSLCTEIKNLSPITGTSAYYIHLSTEDPFSSSDNTDKMDDVFGEGGWTEEYFDTMDPDSIFNESTCFVYLEGGAYTANEFKLFLTNNITDIENWVASGGNLILNAAPYEGSNINLGFDGTTLNYPSYVYTAEQSTPFAIFEGPHLPVGSVYYGWFYNFAHAKITGTGLTKLIEDYYTPSTAVLSFKEWGSGMVLFGGMTPAEYSTPEDEVANLRRNMFELMKYCSPVDIGVVSLISPPDGCGLDSTEVITIEVENFGPTAVSSFPVKYKLDAAPEVNEIATVIAETGSTVIFSFTATGNFAAIGTHELQVWSDVYVDEDHSNDTLTINIETLEAPIVDLGNDTTVCDFMALDAENPDMYYLWSSGETTQTIDVTEPGTYIAYVTHPITGCIKSDTINVDLVYTPLASFTYTTVGSTVTFTNTSTPGAIYTWYFGDGTFTNEFSPTHTFEDGSFTVALVAENNCGDDYFYIVISFTDGSVTTITDPDLNNLALVYPNPTSGNATLDMNFDKSYNVSYEIYNSVGELVGAANLGKLMQQRHNLDTSNLPGGTYMIRVQADDKSFTKSLIIVK